MSQRLREMKKVAEFSAQNDRAKEVLQTIISSMSVENLEGENKKVFEQALLDCSADKAVGKLVAVSPVQWQEGLDSKKGRLADYFNYVVTNKHEPEWRRARALLIKRRLGLLTPGIAPVAISAPMAGAGAGVSVTVDPTTFPDPSLVTRIEMIEAFNRLQSSMKTRVDGDTIVGYDDGDEVRRVSIKEYGAEVLSSNLNASDVVLVIQGRTGYSIDSDAAKVLGRTKKRARIADEDAPASVLHAAAVGRSTASFGRGRW